MRLEIAWAKLFSWSFWFTLSPARLSRTFLFALVGIYVGLAFFAVVLRFLQIRYRSIPVVRSSTRLAAPQCSAIGLAGLSALFFRQEEIYFLGWRWWFLVLGAWILWAGYRIARIYRRVQASTSA